MYKEAIRPAWAEINLSNLDYNIKQIRAKIGEDREMIGVIKADAYGHGSVKVAEVLRENGVKTLAIATLQEAVTLREAGAKEEIIMLGLTPDMYADVIVEYDITPVVCDAANAAAIAEAAKKRPLPLFSKASLTFAQTNSMSEAKKSFSGNSMKEGDIDKPCMQYFFSPDNFDDEDFQDEFSKLARIVYAPWREQL